MGPVLLSVSCHLVPKSRIWWKMGLWACLGSIILIGLTEVKRHAHTVGSTIPCLEPWTMLVERGSWASAGTQQDSVSWLWMLCDQLLQAPAPCLSCHVVGVPWSVSQNQPFSIKLPFQRAFKTATITATAKRKEKKERETERERKEKSKEIKVKC